MTKAPRMSLGDRLRRERERRHLTQEDLSKQLGVSVMSLIRWEKGQFKPSKYALKQLVELFGPVEAWGGDRVRVWTVPYLRNLYFTGRERILTRLYRVLSEQNIVAVSQVRAISGLGGIGKTQTAVEYAYRYADEYDLVLWLHADSREALVVQFASLAPLFGLPNHADADQNQLAKAVKRRLEEEQGWLLIFDNVNDIQVVKEFVPQRSKGAVLLTTRLHAVGKHMRKIELDKLSLEEGIQFLQARRGAVGEQGLAALPEAERQAAEQLYLLMDGLPLALDQAAAYIEEHQCSLAEYVALYQQQRATFLRLRNNVDPEDYPDSVATTWLLSFQRVEQTSPVARDLLRLLAFLHPDAIPEEVLQSGVAEVSPHLQAVAENPVFLQQAIDLLQSYSLVQYNLKTKILTMHRLVQVVIQDDLDVSQARQCAESAVRLVNRAFPDGEFANWERCEQLVPHALVCANHIQERQLFSEEAAHLLHQVGEYFYWRARYGEALTLSKLALAIRKQVLPPSHPDMAESLNNVAFGYSEQSQYAEALPLYQQALTIWEQALGPNHPSVALCLNNLAEVYREQGQYTEALPRFKRALAIEEQAQGPNSPQAANYLNNLALLYQAKGQAKEALQCFQQALAIWEQALGSNHPLVATCLNNLGGLYREQGQYEEARLHLQRALTIEEQELRPNHPSLAQSLNHLGGLYREQGQFVEALLHLQRALAIREEAYGPNHKVVAQSLVNLAELYQAQEQYEEALPLLKRALEIRKQTLGPLHPNTQTARKNYVSLLRAMVRKEEAASLEPKLTPPASAAP